MSNTMRKIVSIITSIFTLIAVVFAILLVGVRFVGLQPYCVLSGSMEPTYHVGSLIYVVDVDPKQLKLNDPVTFMVSDSMVATHRIVDIHQDEEDANIIRFTTKGDANESRDGDLLHMNNVIGKPVFSIPLLGYVANFIQTPPGLYIAIAFVAILVILVFIPDTTKEKGGKKNEKC